MTSESETNPWNMTIRDLFEKYGTATNIFKTLVKIDNEYTGHEALAYLLYTYLKEEHFRKNPE